MASTTTTKPATAGGAPDNGHGVGSVANLLKMMQAAAADLPAADRQKKLREVLDRETKKLNAEDRAAFLDRLADFFPAWGQVITRAAPAPAAAPPPDAKTLAKSLVDQFARLGAPDQDAVRQILLQGKVILPPPPPPPVVEKAPEKAPEKPPVKAEEKAAPPPPAAPAQPIGPLTRDRLKALLGESYFSPKMPANPDLARPIELLRLLADQYIKLEEAVSSQFPKKQGGESDENLPVSPESVQHYLCMSETDGKRVKVKQEIENQLTGLNYRVWSMMKAVESLPRRYARTRSPSAIEDAPELQAGGKGFFGGDKKFQKCWEKYIELCGGRDSGNLVKSMSDLYAQILGEILQARLGAPGRAPTDSSAPS